MIPMIQGTTEDAAWRICTFFFHLCSFILMKQNSIQNFKDDNGFGTVCKIDAGFYAQGFFLL